MSTRRDFIKGAGMLVVGIGAAGVAETSLLGLTERQPTAAGPYPDLDFRQLDSWIVIRADNTATFHVGKTDLGQGTGTAFRQIMSDELDIAYDRTSVVMGSTDVTVDQGGSGGSDALQTDGWPMRRVAAEARRALLGLASVQLGVPVDQLSVSEGVVAVTADPSRKVTYGELDRRQAVQRDVDRKQRRRDDGHRQSQDRRSSSRGWGSRFSATTSQPRWMEP